MPELEVTSNARPSLFGYPAKLEEKKDKTREKVETAILSITAKHKKKKGEKTPTPDTDSTKTEKMDTSEKKEAVKAEEKKVKEKEPTFEKLTNPSRVMKQQLKVLSMPSETARYVPVKPVTTGGILLLKDTKPEDDEKLVEVVKAGGPKKEADEDEGVEPEAPEPFEWPDDI